MAYPVLVLHHCCFTRYTNGIDNRHSETKLPVLSVASREFFCLPTQSCLRTDITSYAKAYDTSMVIMLNTTSGITPPIAKRHLGRVPSIVLPNQAYTFRVSECTTGATLRVIYAAMDNIWDTPVAARFGGKIR